MRCSDARDKLAAYADDALAAGARDAVAEHLRACAGCRGELEALHAALGALHRAGTHPAPDLWDSFRARLAAEAAPALSCERAGELMLAALDQPLAVSDERPLAAHLERCPDCAREAGGLRAAARALEAAAPAAETPDLWPAFRARLAGEMACADALRLVPGLADGAAPSLVLAAHLDHCAACAAELAAQERALAALTRAAAAPAPNLWPAFAARLAAEAAPRRRGFWQEAARPLRGLLAAPGLRPALALAAAAVVVAVTVRTLLPRSPAPGGVTLARRLETPAPPPAPEAESPVVSTAGPEPDVRGPVRRSTARGARQGPSGPRSRARVRVRRWRDAAPRVAGRDRREPRVTAPQPAPETPERVLVADASAPQPPGVESSPEVNSPMAQSRVMPEVVQIVKLLAEAQDAPLRAFEAGLNE